MSIKLFNEKGHIKYIPSDLMKILPNIKINYNISQDVDAFKKIGELSLIGMEVDNFNKNNGIKGFMKRKKGNIMDVGFIAISVFLLGIFLLISVYTYNTFYDKAINITQINESQPTTTALKDARTVINSRLDKITFVFMIGLLLAAIITGWLVGNNALYLFIYFLILVIFIIVSAILSFVWDKLTTSSSHLATVMQYLPVTNHIIGNLPLYITIIGFIGMIVSFAKPYSQNQY